MLMFVFLKGGYLFEKKIKNNPPNFEFISEKIFLIKPQVKSFQTIVTHA